MDGETSAEAAATPFGLPAASDPNPPSGVTAIRDDSVVGAEKIKVSWSASSGATGYRIYRKLGTGTVTCAPNVTLIGTTTSQFEFTDAAPPDTGRAVYSVTALGPNGASSYSASAAICIAANIEGPVDTTLTTCPAGDADKIQLAVGMESTCGTQIGVNGSSLRLVRDASSDTRVHFWGPSLNAGQVRDTTGVLFYDATTQRAIFVVDKIAGCGRLAIRLMTNGVTIAGPLGFQIRSVDQDGHAIGSVDRFDAAAWSTAGSGPGCWDLNWSGTTGLDDFVVLSSPHLSERHHVRRKLISPNTYQRVPQTQALPISWVQAMGDSARVSLNLLRANQPSYKVVIAADVLDGGSLNWVIPASVPSGVDYRVELIHSAGYLLVDGIDVGRDTSDTVFEVGGGGGGGCPVAETLTPAGWVTENSILGRNETGTLATDGLKLTATASMTGEKYRLRLRENEQERTTLDAVSLAALDRDPTVRSFKTASGYLYGTRSAAARAWRSSGEDLTAFVTGLSDSGVVLAPGDTLYVGWTSGLAAGAMSLMSAGSGRVVADDASLFVMESMVKDLPPDEMRAGPRLESTLDQQVLAGTGLLIQKEGVPGEWLTVSLYYPRARFEEAVTGGVGTGKLRIIAIGRHRLRFVGRVIPALQSVATPTILIPTAAQHTRLGNVRPAVANSGSQVTYLEPGDTLSLQFDAPIVPTGKVRDLFLVTRGVYTSITTAGTGSPQVAAVSLKFELGPARPNPSTGRVAIAYSLARQTVARMRIYNVAGRLVRTLVDGEQEAGPHEVTWDGRSNSGIAAGAGVYFYRLEAGSWSSEKKLIVLER